MTIAGRAVVVAVSVALGATSVWAVQPEGASKTEFRDEFFIVSSIDPSKGQLLLKRPTEVTDVVRVDGQTHYLDERGRAIALGQLRAGDTVFVRVKPGGVALEIRKGPMTVSELQKRYLHHKH